MEVLKTFAEESASLLDVALPELGLAARSDRPAFEQRRCLAFQVPCPSAGITTPLSVVVTQDEITVEFLGARRRFVGSRLAVDLIRELIAETVILAAWYSDFYSEMSRCRRKP
jgi:hypothetical protein